MSMSMNILPREEDINIKPFLHLSQHTLCESDVEKALLVRLLSLVR
jgi:hypothetical protein